MFGWCCKTNITYHSMSGNEHFLIYRGQIVLTSVTFCGIPKTMANARSGGYAGRGRLGGYVNDRIRLGENRCHGWGWRLVGKESVYLRQVPEPHQGSASELRMVGNQINLS